MFGLYLARLNYVQYANLNSQNVEKMQARRYTKYRS